MLETIQINNFSLQNRDLQFIAPELLNGGNHLFEMFMAFSISYRESPPAGEGTPVTASSVSARALFDLYVIMYEEPKYSHDETNGRVLTAIEQINETELEDAIDDYVASVAAEIVKRKAFGKFKISGVEE